MTTTNHTPGPWKHDETWGLIKYGKTEICALHSGNEANAHLIAAAPDLLSALKALHSCHRAFSQNENWTTLDDEARKFAEAAIAKAEGAK